MKETKAAKHLREKLIRKPIETLEDYERAGDTAMRSEGDIRKRELQLLKFFDLLEFEDFELSSNFAQPKHLLDVRFPRWEEGKTRWSVSCVSDEMRRCKYRRSGDLMTYMKSLREKEEFILDQDWETVRKRLRTCEGYVSDNWEHVHPPGSSQIPPTRIDITLKIKDSLVEPFMKAVFEFWRERKRYHAYPAR